MIEFLDLCCNSLPFILDICYAYKWGCDCMYLQPDLAFCPAILSKFDGKKLIELFSNFIEKAHNFNVPMNIQMIMFLILQATIHMIASHLGATLHEWNTPTPTIWQEHAYNCNAGISSEYVL